MGNKGSKDFASIAANSRLDEKDLKELLKTFQKIAGSDGLLDKAELKAVIEKKYGGIDPTFSNILFNLFDRNNDKTVNFSEFCLAYGYLVNRSLDDVIDVSFRCLDLNNDGFISRSEMRAVVMMNKKMEKYVKVYNRETPIDKIQLLPIEVSKINQEADELFDLLDKNNDKQVSKDEFLQLVNTDAEIKRRLTSMLVKDESVDFFK
ncbi:recoverin family protein [Heterostelium album PN500]|uniref:Recoverin family protein n=1 Tax=Heterostelium pallidum (strain ATCC 26659 / Pp 5 / PN500) TaxID=670386 RepID=D3BNS7_HETP5|nr:recoverin family protein [Heterostelium album PN500]EFA76846.1 recoverin family protein [Heterostelium album PN500]|eukprot:XP_020428978.1 recoverin family protein [Heterostelium album PN500]